MWDAISCGKAQQMKTECTHDYLGHAGDSLPLDPGPVERTQVVEVWKGGKVLGAEDGDDADGQDIEVCRKLDETLEYYKSARTVDAKGRVFPGPLTQSALAGGRRLFFQVKCMIRSENTVIDSILGPRQPPQFLVLQLCGKDCHKQNVEFRFSLAIWPDLTPSWVRMSGGKSRVKNDRFLSGGACAEKLWKIVSQHPVFLHVVLSKHCKY